MSSGRIRRATGAFGFQLNFWYVAAFGLSLLLLGLGSHVVLERAVELAERQQIEAKLDQYLAVYQAGGLPALAEQLDRDADPPVGLRVSDRRDRTLLLTTSRPDLHLNLQTLRLVEKDDRRMWFRVQDDAGIEQFRVGAARLPRGRRLEVLMSEARGEEVLDAYDRGLAVVLPLAVLLGLIGGLVLTRRARRPIRALVDTTQHVLASGELDARVPSRGTGDELDELGILYNRMLDTNQRLVEGMREALDNVAHDLKTPLTRLRMAAELGLSHARDPKKAEEAFADCLEESDRVLATLKALMDVSEAEAGVLALERAPVDLADLAREVEDLYGYVAEDKEIALAVEAAPAPVSGDATNLRRVAANLVDNALKYTPSGGRVTVRTGGDGGRGWLEVEDTGVGVAEADHERIFRRLYRADPSRSERGLGLGLSFVQAIVHAHGGRVEVHSEVGRGARFRIVL